ncbi:Lysine-specific demethylase JMJ30 (AtJMJ30) (JmjC domain-containing protein 30) (Jumonji domain-containing protein 5) (AtJMJD5) [Durusdinium trenchii]|uniref:Lysine-specific demethylase JMJ30 (AtJMJ30) (JmjC domain-containing protein 30) (Jumonji domain-containing protein 5) (AtJMJD5) n=1 Tax=Durusdinium trenchii TaxID=1381693 RepID=A0ABP0JTB8_9DINO
MSTKASLAPLRAELLKVSEDLASIGERVKQLAQRLNELEGSANEDLEWEVIEEGNLPLGVSDLEFPYPGASQVPQAQPIPSVPRYLSDLCQERLKSVASISPLERAQRAFTQGHLAWVARVTGLHYRPADAVPALPSAHFVVIRGLGLSQALRTTTKREALRALAVQDDTAIIEDFPSFIEVQVFCVRASTEAMQRSSLRLAEVGDPNLLVFSIPSEVSKTGGNLQVFAIPVLQRDGGFLVALPVESFSNEALETAAHADEHELLGPSHTCVAQLSEEDENGQEVMIDQEILVLLAAVTYAEPAGGQSPGVSRHAYPQLPALGQGFAHLGHPKEATAKKVAAMVGPPPKTRKAPPAQGALALPDPFIPEEPRDLFPAQIETHPMLSALAQQSTALTTLVSHLAGHDIDIMTSKKQEGGGRKTGQQTSQEQKEGEASPKRRPRFPKKPKGGGQPDTGVNNEAGQLTGEAQPAPPVDKGQENSKHVRPGEHVFSKYNHEAKFNALQQDMTLTKWCACLTSAVLRTRTPFAAHLAQTFHLHRTDLSTALAFFPVPLPTGEHWARMPPDLSQKRRRQVHLNRAVHIIVLALNYYHNGGPCKLDLLGRAPSTSHRSLYARIRSLIRSEGQVAIPCIANSGRRLPQLVARLSELSVALTAMGPSCNPYDRSFDGFEVLPDTEADELKPYRNLDSSRLVLTGRGAWDATEYLEDELVLAYREPAKGRYQRSLHGDRLGMKGLRAAQRKPQQAELLGSPEKDILSDKAKIVGSEEFEGKEEVKPTSIRRPLAYRHVVIEGKLTKASAMYTGGLADALATVLSEAINARASADLEWDQVQTAGLANALVNQVVEHLILKWGPQRAAILVDSNVVRHQCAKLDIPDLVQLAELAFQKLERMPGLHVPLACVKCEPSLKMPFSEFLESLKKRHCPFYLGKAPIATELPSLQKHLDRHTAETDAAGAAITPLELFGGCFGALVPAGVYTYMGAGRNTTSIHFDGYENLMMCMRGKKHICLWPPWAAAQLYPVGESFSCPDGFTRSAVSPGGLRFEELEAEEQARLACYRHAEPLRLTLEPGQLLYLPAGWWHCVEGSMEPNMILNWWFSLHPQKIAQEQDAK